MDSALRDRSIRFSAVGDITLGDHPLCVGFGAFSRFRKEEPLFPFQQSLDVLQRAELLFGNLECTHSSLGLRRGGYHSVQMRGEPRLLDALPAAGFNVVNVANNHSLQHGKEAFLDTVAAVERRGVKCCGLAADAGATRAEPVVVRQSGLSVGFLGYSLRPRQYFEHAPLYAEGEPDAMVRDVESLRQQVDVVIVSVHWGDEFIQEPSPREVLLAHRLADAGAALVIGHHPHVLRGVERRGQSCIVYSLGNFVCDMSWDATLRTSVIFECMLTRDGVQGVNLVPVRINDDFQPEVLSGSAATTVLQDIACMGQKLQRHLPLDGPASDREYARQADLALRDMRSKSQRFFLSRFWKYPPQLLVQQLGRYFRNRIHERLSRA